MRNIVLKDVVEAEAESTACGRWWRNLATILIELTITTVWKFISSWKLAKTHKHKYKHNWPLLCRNSLNFETLLAGYDASVSGPRILRLNINWSYLMSRVGRWPPASMQKMSNVLQNSHLLYFPNRCSEGRVRWVRWVRWTGRRLHKVAPDQDQLLVKSRPGRRSTNWHKPRTNTPHTDK